MRFASWPTFFLACSALGLGALAWSAQQGAVAPRVLAAPPVHALDAPVPHSLLAYVGTEIGLAAQPSALGAGQVQITCAAATRCGDAFARDEALRERALRPATAAPFRVVAGAPVEGGRAVLVAWWTAADRLCVLGATLPVGTLVGPLGPCAADLPGATAQRCGAICLQSSPGGEEEDTQRWLLAGTVAGGATALRVTRAAGGPTTYPLRGPLVPHTSRRAVLLDLGGSDWRLLELLRGERVVATEQLPPRQAAIEDCTARGGAPQAVDACVRSAERSVP